MTRRFRPKAWARPRSARAKGNTHTATLIGSVEILKDLWQTGPEEMLRPWWARLARERGWMSAERFYALERVSTGRKIPSLTEALYDNSPMFQLLAKHT